MKDNQPFKDLIAKHGKGWYMWSWTMGLSRTSPRKWTDASRLG